MWNGRLDADTLWTPRAPLPDAPLEPDSSSDEDFEELVIKYQTSGIPRKYADRLAVLHDDGFRLGGTCEERFVRLHAARRDSCGNTLFFSQIERRCVAHSYGRTARVLIFCASAPQCHDQDLLRQLGPKAFRTDDDIAGEEARKAREAREAEEERKRVKFEKRRQREAARRASAKTAAKKARPHPAGGGSRRSSAPAK